MNNRAVGCAHKKRQGKKNEAGAASLALWIKPKIFINR